jgi:CHASE2 domain-containing sensor protein
MRLQRDFWSQIGSFAVPLGLLGGLIAWTGHRGSEPPLWVGVLLLAWLFAAVARVPRGGFWLGLVPAVLLILDRAF